MRILLTLAVMTGLSLQTCYVASICYMVLSPCSHSTVQYMVLGLKVGAPCNIAANIQGPSYRNSKGQKDAIKLRFQL